MINDRDARRIASEWHGGQWSPLYALASSGALVPGVHVEIAESITAAAPNDFPADLYDLLCYVRQYGPRDAVTDWTTR